MHYRYRFTLHLGDMVGYIKFVATERVDEEYVKDAISELYNTGKYTEIDEVTGKKYINTYDMNKDLVEKHTWWLQDSSKYFENELYLG